MKQKGVSPMKTMLFVAEKANFEGKVSGSLMLKSAALGGANQVAQDYGREVGKGLSVS